MAGLCVRWQPPLVTTSPASTRSVIPPLRHARLSTLRRYCPGVLQRRRVQSFELQHTCIYEDGYVVLQNLFTESEVTSLGNPDMVQSSLLAGERGQLVLNLVGDVVKVELESSRVQEVGFKCTDDATSPEPWWDYMWEVENLDIDNQQRLKSASKVASLVISCSGRTRPKCGGGFCVYPRSHWLVADWSWAISGSISDSTMSTAIDVPAATVVELDLDCGDAVLLHPFLAWSLAPNMSKSAKKFLFFNLHIAPPTGQRLSGRNVVQMWHGWTALTCQLTKGLPGLQSEEVEHMKEEVEAIRGVSLEGSMPELPFSCSYLAPRDHLSWQLRSCVNELMQKEKWEETMVMLQRLAGLRPGSYWVAYQAGRCCMLSAPRGQLAGRAGRKSRLEDAERFLLRAIEMAPGWPLAYKELVQVLLLLGRGREEGIPEIIRNMKRRCDVGLLCSKYPQAYSELKQCQDWCEGFSC